jgi:SpoIID/LytB domain protein
MHNTIPTYHRVRGVLNARALARAALARRGSATLKASALCALALCSSAGTAHATELVVQGAGWGHGVGMSQEGAAGFAEHGYTYDGILAHYYSGSAIGQAPAGARVRVLVGKHVRSMPLETYVRGVVAAEMPSSWPAAALQAQAVASRTYALMAHAGGSRFDVYADTRSQVYRGAAAYTPTSDAAVAATAGQIVTYEGAPAITYFFASSGGRTESVEDAFAGAAPQPWLRSVSDPFERGALHSWTVALSYAAVSKQLHGLLRGAFVGIEVSKRGYSPRILSAYVLGSGGRTLVSGATLAARLGLYDSWAFFSARSGTTLSAMPDRTGARPGAPVTSLPTTPLEPGGGVSAAGEGESARTASVQRSGGTSAPS